MKKAYEALTLLKVGELFPIEINCSLPRLNLFPDGYELYDFESGKILDKNDWPQFHDFEILNRLLDLKQQLGMNDWLLKYDVLIGSDDYVVLDIGMDPPYRMKKYWESQELDFIDFYINLYLNPSD